jgi:hypothetical protein
MFLKTDNMTGATCWAESAYPSRHLTLLLVFSGVCVARSLVLCVMFCSSLFVFLPLCCLSFYLWLLITSPLISSIDDYWLLPLWYLLLMTTDYFPLISSIYDYRLLPLWYLLLMTTNYFPLSSNFSCTQYLRSFEFLYLITFLFRVLLVLFDQSFVFCNLVIF